MSICRLWPRANNNSFWLLNQWHFVLLFPSVLLGYLLIERDINLGGQRKEKGIKWLGITSLGSLKHEASGRAGSRDHKRYHGSDSLSYSQTKTLSSQSQNCNTHFFGWETQPKEEKLWVHLAGWVGRARDSWSEGGEFTPYTLDIEPT